MCHAICEGMWLRRMLTELKVINEGPTILYTDNKAAIDIARNPVHHERTKHVEIDRHFIKEKLEMGEVHLKFVPSEQQTANILTKALSRQSFEQLCSKLGWTD